MNKKLQAQTLSTYSFHKAFPYETAAVNSCQNVAVNYGIENFYNGRTEK